MESIHELNTILSSLEKNDYFTDFLNTKSLEAGIINLREDQKDTQDTHPLDELYYVIEGKGMISINGKDHEIKQGTLIFVPAYSEHKFHGNKNNLLILYILAKG